MNEMLPCPFCGNDQVEVLDADSEYYVPAVMSACLIQCECGCALQGKWESREAAINRWNARPETWPEWTDAVIAKIKARGQELFDRLHEKDMA